MRRYIACLMGLAMVLGFIGVSSAATVTDPTGDQLTGGPTDISGVRAELTDRGDGQGVLKLSLQTAASNLGGIVVFEADVDNSTGTGGSFGMTGIVGNMVPACRGGCSGGCKVVAGTDIAVVIINRIQGANSTQALPDPMTGLKARIPGEWYAIGMAVGMTDVTGFIRGFMDPTPNFSTTSHSYTLPWDNICVWVDAFTPEPFGITTCGTAANVQWQVSVWTDPNYDPMTSNQDDMGNGITCMDISDWAPNAGLVNGLDVGDALTYCEGNFDGNLTCDGLDAAKFKSDFGRSGIKNPCPKSNYMW